MEDKTTENQRAVETISTKSINLPVSTLISSTVIIFIVYSFFFGLILKFYASFLFFFYDLVQRMWIAVIMLGLFQALIMIPLRVISLIISNHTDEFIEKTAELKSEKEQAFLIKKSVRQGSRPILFYLINFTIQFTSYVTIGRLFLTDFYNTRLNPTLLFPFSPYPEYPIQDTIFKIPYPKPVSTTDLGTGAIFIAWTIIILFQFLIYAYRFMQQRSKPKEHAPLIQIPKQADAAKRYLRYASGNSVILFILSWILFRNFPNNWQIKLFTGNISIPNRTFNTITAIVTFLTLMWFGINRINRKTQLANQAKINKDIIFRTQKDMFKDLLKTATFVGLGAYFITNHIPSAFELSIFTFELIAILSPFTLDKLILRTTKSTSLK